MEIYKVIKILCILFLVSAITGCEENSAQYERLMKKYEALKRERDEAVQGNVKQLKNINRLYEQLDTINLEMGSIRTSAGNNEMNVPTQVERIDAAISNIKKELTRLETEYHQLTSYNRELIKTVSHLKKVVLEKEKEITLLKEDLRLKEGIITDQQNQISQKDLELADNSYTINQKNNELEQKSSLITQKNRELEQMQIRKWKDMGKELNGIYQEYLNISKGLFKATENERRMNANKRNVLEKAQKCYIEAYNLGSKDAEQELLRINKELNSLPK